MSGGIAYVLDLNPSVLNTEMVDLEEPTPADLEQVHALVRRHEEETGSMVAATLLADWATSATRFSKIMPRDYRRVLDAQAAAERDGRDVLDAIMEAAHG
jgi:glutamate synthase (NADPH) large chain